MARLYKNIGEKREYIFTIKRATKLLHPSSILISTMAPRLLPVSKISSNPGRYGRPLTRLEDRGAVNRLAGSLADGPPVCTHGDLH